MLAVSSRTSRRFRGAARAAVGVLLVSFACGTALGTQEPALAQTAAPGGQASVKKSTEPAPAQRIPRQQALTTAAVDGVLREAVSQNESRPVAAAQLTLRHLQTGQIVRATSSAEGVFRILLVLPGHYATERGGVEDLAARLQERWPDLAVWASEREREPLASGVPGKEPRTK